MARIRTIKPDFFNDDDVVALSDTAKVVFIGLWGHCDGQGVFQAKFQQLKRAIKPDQDMKRSMETICRQDLKKFIHYFVVEDQEYGLVLGFCKHQRIDIKNDPPRFPLPKDFSRNNSQVWVKNSRSTRNAHSDNMYSTSLPLVPEGRKEGERNRKGKGSGKEELREKYKSVQEPSDSVGDSCEKNSEAYVGKNGKNPHNDSLTSLEIPEPVLKRLRKLTDEQLQNELIKTLIPGAKLAIEFVQQERLFT